MYNAYFLIYSNIVYAILCFVFWFVVELICLIGLIGAIISGVAMEMTRAYKAIIKTYVFSALVLTVIFVTQMKQDNFFILAILFAVYGFCAVPIIAITFECAVTLTLYITFPFFPFFSFFSFFSSVLF